MTALSLFGRIDRPASAVLFAGLGGSCEGIRRATGTSPIVAVNHCEHALWLHARNHPETLHLREDVWDVVPRQATRGRKLDLLWLSPDCTHHSRAKGGKPRDTGRRSLADVAIPWAEDVAPRVIMLENVPEWCFPAETTVLAKRGIVAIGDIRVGDEVWTHNARWKPVVAVSRSVKPTLSVVGYGNSIVETTENHRFYARQYTPKITQGGKRGRHEARLLEPEWVRADRLADCDRTSTYTESYSGYAWATPLELPRYWMRLPVSAGIDAASPAFFYMLGRWLGDGWIKKRNRKQSIIRICANLKEADKLEQKLSETGLKWYRSNHTTTVDVFDLCAESSRKLIPWLRSNFGEYAHKKTLPAWVYAASDAQRWALIDGYHDADGHRQVSGIIGSVSVSRCLAVGMKLLLQSLGVAASIRKSPARDLPRVDDPDRTMTCRDAYCVTWRRETEWEKCHRSELHLWGRVRSVQPCRDAVEVVDITVADDHSFVADGQVVHNCDWGPLYPDDHPVEKLRGRPIPERKGEFFRTWCAALEALGYAIEWRILKACDYGVPTSRRRVYLIARRDGRPIRWPDPTHGPGLEPYRTAAECIDWSIPWGRNLLDSPLRPDSMSRVSAGRAATDGPFLVVYYGTGTWASIDEPLQTVTTVDRFGLCVWPMFRMLQPRELARAMGFDDSYILEGTKAEQVARIGNAVCPGMARALVEVNL